MSTINKIKIENTVYNIEDIDARNELKNKASMTEVTEYIEEHKDELKGADGVDGKDGVDGYTPKKGVDYWNEEDKEEIRGFIDGDVANLEALLRNILAAIQNNTSATMTIEEIEQLIVSYFETKSVEEVEQ